MPHNEYKPFGTHIGIVDGPFEYLTMRDMAALYEPIMSLAQKGSLGKRMIWSSISFRPRRFHIGRLLKRKSGNVFEEQRLKL
jgi:hypothetical protein